MKGYDNDLFTKFFSPIRKALHNWVSRREQSYFRPHNYDFHNRVLSNLNSMK